MRLRTIRDAARRHSCEPQKGGESRNPAPSEYLEPEALDPGFRRDDEQIGPSFRRSYEQIKQAWKRRKPSWQRSENRPSFLRTPKRGREQESSAFACLESKSLDPGFHRDDGYKGKTTRASKRKEFFPISPSAPADIA